MFENIRLSFQGIWSHKLRSFLTMLGIIIGIAAIIAIVSTIEGTNELIKQNMMGNNRHTVKVQLSQDDYTYEISTWNPSPEGVPLFDEDHASGDSGKFQTCCVLHFIRCVPSIIVLFFIIISR